MLFRSQQKLQSGGKKTDGPDAQGGQSKPAGGGGDSGGGTQASSQKQGWKSRLTKIGSEVTGIGDMKQQAKKTFVGDKATGQKSTYQQTKELTKTAFGKGSQREKWNAMQRTDGELATQNTQDRYDRYLKKKETAKKSELMAKAQKSNPQLAAKIGRAHV